jgi:hypothetical protein
VNQRSPSASTAEFFNAIGTKLTFAWRSNMPLKQMQFMRFDGKQWERFGEILTAN